MSLGSFGPIPVRCGLLQLCLQVLIFTYAPLLCEWLHVVQLNPILQGTGEAPCGSRPKQVRTGRAFGTYGFVAYLDPG